MKVLVVGDVALDVYWVGTPKGLSAEAPVPVVGFEKLVQLPGMGANVAQCLQDLGLHVRSATRHTDHYSVKNRLVTPEGHQFIRWDVEDWCTPVDIPHLQALLQEFTPDAVVVSDYAKGAVTVQVRETLLALDLPLYVDTKGDPFEWIRERGEVTLFPNQKEYTQWKEHYDWMESVVLKCGAAGAVHLRFGKPTATQEAPRVTACNVCGAGDSFLAGWIRACRISATNPLQEAVRVAAQYVSQPFWNRRLADFE